MDPYLAPPREPVPAGRFDWLRPWLTTIVVVLLLASIAAIWLVSGRQDPSLEVPDDIFSTDAPLAVPEAVPSSGS